MDTPRESSHEWRYNRKWKSILHDCRHAIMLSASWMTINSPRLNNVFRLSILKLETSKFELHLLYAGQSTCGVINIFRAIQLWIRRHWRLHPLSHNLQGSSCRHQELINPELLDTMCWRNQKKRLKLQPTHQLPSTSTVSPVSDIVSFKQHTDWSTKIQDVQRHTQFWWLRLFGYI